MKPESGRLNISFLLLSIAKAFSEKVWIFRKIISCPTLKLSTSEIHHKVN